MFRKKKREKHFSDYIVAAAITAIALYTVSAVVLQFCGFMEISPLATSASVLPTSNELSLIFSISSGE